MSGSQVIVIVVSPRWLHFQSVLRLSWLFDYFPTAVTNLDSERRFFYFRLRRCLSTGSHKNYQTDSNNTWMEDDSRHQNGPRCPRSPTIQIKGRIQECSLPFSNIVRLSGFGHFL